MFVCLELVNEDLGFQYGNSTVFPDESLATSPDEFDTNFANPKDGRLYEPEKMWCPKLANEPFYLELILVKKYYIFAVSIQAKLLDDDRNTKTNFSISYSDNYAIWQHYNAIFQVSFLKMITSSKTL